MTLLNAAQNREIQNYSYEQKRSILSQAQFQITKDLATNATTWNPTAVASRQKELARLASSVWKVSQLS